MSLYEILQGDALEVLGGLEAESVDCCVTSPPYWGLRDYGAEDQLGLEPTPEEYVAKLVAVFEQVRRVLKPEGTLWLNLGDSYAGAGNNKPNTGILKTQAHHQDEMVRFERKGWQTAGLKPKDLVGIPWRVAFALQAAGWWLRLDIIWAKDNPMPESVTDRPTKAHEYLFLLAKSERYYYDKDAIAEPVKPVSLERARYKWNCDRPSTQNAAMGGEGIHVGEMGDRFVNPEGRNARSVWRINTAPYAEAHFATFPLALPERCIRAGCPVDGVVLDPFGGSGTTAVAALKNQRRALLIELNPEYVEMAHRRIEREAGGQQLILEADDA